MDNNDWEIVNENNTQGIEVKQRPTENIDNETADDIRDRFGHHRYGQNVISYETEWRTIGILSEDPKLQKLKEMAINGDLKVSKFRSVCWNILLGALCGPMSNWSKQRHQQRTQYNRLKAKYWIDPHLLKLAEERDNPLSQSKDSIWNQHFRDQELCNLIRQDVVRTNPTVEFYRKENIQEIMINILFCYAREYPAVCYRQGMHEVLAPLIFVLHSDHQNLGHIVEEMKINLDPILTDVLDSKYLEVDTYFLFCKIMNSLELFYRINDMTITESGQLTSLKDSPVSSAPTSPTKGDNTRRSSEIEVVHQLNVIRDKILAKEDMHLHNHLSKLEIPLALFGIRWLRLLFGREFTLLDLLVLWDSIIGVGDNLKFTHYILVAMLIRIRDKLLSSDYTNCLTMLMRYPQNVDVMLIIRHALHMKSPNKYECPPNAFVYVTYKNVNSKMITRHPVGGAIQYNKPNGSPVHHRILTAATSNLASATNVTMDYRLRSSSLPRKTTTATELHNESTKATMKYVAQSQTQTNWPPAEEDFGIVDGFFVDDPEILKMELQDSYNIMAVSRIKLLQYLTILRKYAPGNHVDELHQTIDGIEELCSLLKPKNQYLFNIAAPVEPAFEAEDENASPPTNSGRDINNSTNHQHSQSNLYSSMIDNTNDSDLLYEVPVNKISRNAGRLLKKNRKEVEMNVFQLKNENKSLDDNTLPLDDPVGERDDS